MCCEESRECVRSTTPPQSTIQMTPSVSSPSQAKNAATYGEAVQSSKRDGAPWCCINCHQHGTSLECTIESDPSVTCSGARLLNSSVAAYSIQPISAFPLGTLVQSE